MPRGTIGELCTRGYSVMLGYWNNPQGHREAIDEAGWMHTGDLASMNEEGYVNIAGRNKDMIIRGGENIYPRELEEFFFTHPAVADVQVIGIPMLALRRGDCRLDQIPPRPQRHRAGAANLVQGAHRALQDAAALQVRRRVSDDGDGQDPEIQDARNQHRRAENIER